MFAYILPIVLDEAPNRPARLSRPPLHRFTAPPRRLVCPGTD